MWKEEELNLSKNGKRDSTRTSDSEFGLGVIWELNFPSLLMVRLRWSCSYRNESDPGLLSDVKSIA